MGPEIGVPKAAKMCLRAAIGRFLPPIEHAREALGYFQTVSPRTPVNRASLDAPGFSGWHDAYGKEELRNVTSEIDTGDSPVVLGEG